MSTEPTTGSVEDIANLISQPPQEEENLNEVADAVIEEPQDTETEETVEVTESEDVADHESDQVEEVVDEDGLDEDTAVSYELSDDMELEYKSDGEIKKATIGELKRSAAGQEIQRRADAPGNRRPQRHPRVLYLQHWLTRRCWRDQGGQ